MWHWISQHSAVFGDIALVWLTPALVVTISAKLMRRIDRRPDASLRPLTVGANRSQGPARRLAFAHDDGDQLARLFEARGLLGEEGLFKALTKALVKRALGAELNEDLRYEKGDPAGRGTANCSNGYSDKMGLTSDGEIGIAVSRDRKDNFEPVMVPKGERRRRAVAHQRAARTIARVLVPPGDLYRVSEDAGA
jgi:hypothetical protein